MQRDYEPLTYQEAHLDRVAFPLGGIGAGMICLEGSGALSHVSIQHRPEIFHEPCLFAALKIRDQPDQARILEGPVPRWKLFGRPGSGKGCEGTSYGLPRMQEASFQARFPFATINFTEKQFPLKASLTGWSPFVPGDEDVSSLPVAALEYTLTNPTDQAVEAIFSFHAKNFLEKTAKRSSIQSLPGGFTLQSTAPERAFACFVDAPGVRVNHCWFRGGWWDPLTMAWEDVRQDHMPSRPPTEGNDPAPGASLFLPLSMAPGAKTTVRLQLAWFVPRSELRLGTDAPGQAERPEETYEPWYARRFQSISELAGYWRSEYETLRLQSTRFADTWHQSTLPDVAMEAATANLSILKSPTLLRQADGRLWTWEGCDDEQGVCPGSCTHVLNYAQAIAHLFPRLERTLRETEFGDNQDENGHQCFRAALPIRPQAHDFHSAADGQLGGILKAYRDWRISGDDEWLKRLWPRIRESLEYAIRTWDPEHRGWLEEPHHNTYDIEFWGPNGMCTSLYLGALEAAIRMADYLGADVAPYRQLRERGTPRMEEELFSGEYFIQKTTWEGLHAGDPRELQSLDGAYSKEAIALLEAEGPKYQYGAGCLSDGIIGDWMAQVCGLPTLLDRTKVRSHLNSVFRYNLKRDLTGYTNPQRPGFACGDEGGLLLCTWPHGKKPTLPFIYSYEAWSGIEYQVASHLILEGAVEEGLAIVHQSRARYDGNKRNPFDEYECGHWYMRSLSSFALLQALSGARYDAVDRVLYLHPRIQGDFRCFLATASGYGTVGVRDGTPFHEDVVGHLVVERLDFKPAQKKSS